MEKDQAAKYRKLLEAKLAELAAASIKRDDIAIEKTPDLLDDVRLSEAQELALWNLTRASRVAVEARAALSRIDDGSYGACLNCEEEIKPRRLEAMPWATYCVQCQEIAERDQLELTGPRTEAKETAESADEAFYVLRKAA